jgi:hypothetical protein
MAKFIPANKLTYEVFGHFYSIDFSGGKMVECRSVLEIVRKDSCPDDISQLAESEPDCIFIMMNPGSSCPLEPVDQVVKSSDIGKLEISLVKTKPDTTQYQVMRIMHYKNWNHVRVLNLSDLRNPKSGSFISSFKELHEKYKDGGRIHSLFSIQREQELYNKLKRKIQAPMVCAWGVSGDLDLLIAQSLGQLNGKVAQVGLLKEGTNDKYYHPLPTLQKDKELWVTNMLELLDD